VTVVLGIDGATRAGWSLVSAAFQPRERLSIIDHGVIDLSGNSGRPSELVAALVERVEEHVAISGLRVAIELAYLGRGAKANVETMRLLARFCGRFEQAFGLAGADLELVFPAHWQSRILGSLGGRTRKDRKAAAARWGRATFPGVELSEDDADATAMAVCVLREHERRRVLGIADAP
jgi:Holliday junction resolvasome RuvABC endonuclease subunit